MTNLKPWVKYALLFILIFGGAYLGINYFGGTTVTDNKQLKSLVSESDVITVGVNTYAGFTPIVWLNGGLEPNENSVIYKEYGLKLKIVIQDDFIAGRNAFKSGDIDIIYCTTDVLSTEMSSSSDMIDARQFMILNKSRGSDALVVNKNIKTVADLKGKKIAVAEGTASHTLLINTLETNSINPSAVQIIKVGNGMEAAQAFKALQVDAAVVWSPDDEDCVTGVKGSKVLVSTKHASELISDGLIAKASYIEENRADLTKFVSAVLYANSLMNTDTSTINEGAKYFAKAFGTDEAFCVSGCKNIRFTTLDDATNFLGLNSSYSGAKADEIYSKMARIYESIGLTKSPLSWRKVSDISIIEELYINKNVKGQQQAEASKSFTVPTKELETKSEISNKKLTIQFVTNSTTLDNEARTLIDREFVSIAKQFASTRIRIEGNTDGTGNAEYNKNLSYKRAKSVADYLNSEYGIDKNRFIVIGNGSKRALDNNSITSDAQYRVTDFQLVSE